MSLIRFFLLYSVNTLEVVKYLGHIRKSYSCLPIKTFLYLFGKNLITSEKFDVYDTILKMNVTIPH